MNPLLMLAVFVAVSVFFKPATLNNWADNSTHSPLANKSTPGSSISDPKVIKTPVAVLGIFDKTNWHAGSEIAKGKSRVVSQIATQMLIDALVRSGQCEVVNLRDSRYLSSPDTGIKGEDFLEITPYLKNEGLSRAKYVVQGVITDYGCEVFAGEVDSDSKEKEGPIKYAGVRAVIDLKITEARTGEVIKTLSMRDKLKGKWGESDVFSLAKGNISPSGERESFEQQLLVAMVLSRLINTMVDELAKSEIFEWKPLCIVAIEGVEEDWAEETSLYLARKLVENNIDVTLEIIPCNEDGPLRSSSSLVRKLKKLYESYPDKLEFALQGLKDERHELDKSLKEQVQILSQAQNVFAQAFNKESDKNKILPTSLVPPYMHYNKETIEAAKLVGLETIMGCNFQKDDQGFVLLDGGIIEIEPDEEGNLVNDWTQVRIRPVEEIISCLENVLGKPEKEPLVITINTGTLLWKLGKRGAKRYANELTGALNQLRQKYDIEFTTPAKFYETLNLVL